MSKKYMHLDDTNFPNVDGVNPYKYHNNFDYSRWRGLVGIKLVNVKWNGNYTDVPKWETDVLRDAWFDEQDGIVRPLETLFNVTPENSVRIPIPYNDAYNYNYLVVDMPIQTSQSEPIAYEDENIRIKRWYYFINDMAQHSPNTTELKVSLDYWTMFINTVDIPYLMLERGHAPMVQTDVETYLSNPIENSEYLLAEDFNFGTNNIVKHTNYYPIGNGSKYVLFALPFNKTDFQNLIPGSTLGTSTPATFSNTSHVRWGYQYQVNGYEWNYGGKNYNNSKLPIRNVSSNDSNLFNGVNIFAIKADEASAFFSIIASKYAYVMNAIQACFMLADDMFARNDSFSFEGYTVYKCVKQTDVENITLAKSDFEFDTKYADITKLYTFPYSVLEITDDNGNTFEIKVENTSGNMQMRNEINIAYPYMNYNILFTGINGNGSQQYIWSEISANKNKTIWEDDFSKFMLTWDIPTFSLFVSNETDFNVTNYPQMQADRQGAIVDYHNAVRYADVGYENTEDSLSTQKTNAYASANNTKTNADASANTEKTNADAVASANKVNEDSKANTNYTNANNTALTNRDNANDVADLNKKNADATAKANYDNTKKEIDILRQNIEKGFNRDQSLLYWNNKLIDDETMYNISKLANDAVADLNFMIRAFNYNTQAEVISSALNSAGNMASSGLSAVAGIAGGAVGLMESKSPTALASGVANAAAAGGNAIIGAVVASASTYVQITRNRDLLLKQEQTVRQKVENAQRYATNMQAVRKDYNIGQYNAAKQVNEQIADVNKEMNTGINEKVRDTNYANNDRTKNYYKGNSTTTPAIVGINPRTYNTDTTNNLNTYRLYRGYNNDPGVNKRTYDTQIANNERNWTLYRGTNDNGINKRNWNTETGNADRIYATEEPNAKWNRDSAIEAAKANLNQKQLEMAAKYQSANLAKPVVKATMQGDANPDLWERRGIRVNVRTQTKSAIAQAGDAMLRFGYALNRVWDMENGFDYMKHFTYWKAADVWINDGSGTAGDAVGYIQAILLAGVTVWTNPNEIGTVSIYDNLEYE